MLPQFFTNFVEKYLKDKPAVVNWLLDFTDLAHRVDDLVDKDSRDSEFIISTMSLSRKVFTSPVYLNFRSELDVVDEVINGIYFVSTKWEKSDDQWKRQQADVLRHCGYSMFFAVVYIYCGRQAMMEIIEDFIEHTHTKHKKDFEGVYTTLSTTETTKVAA